MYQLRKYYKVVYEQNKTSMIIFVLIESHMFFYYYILPYIISAFDIEPPNIVWTIYITEY